MTEQQIPDGYSVPCDCPDMPKLTVDLAVIRPQRVWQCQLCGVEWRSSRQRDPGGTTQPVWTATADAPENWTPS